MNIKEAWDIVNSHVTCIGCRQYSNDICIQCEEAQLLINDLIAMVIKQYTQGEQ